MTHPTVDFINFAQDPGSLFWCHIVMSLQFAHVCTSSCRGRLRRVRDFSVLLIGSDCFGLRTFRSRHFCT